MIGPRFASALLVGAVIAAAVRAEGAPKGRVIRVERTTKVVVPRFCAMASVRGQSLCFGRPREGERIAIIDTSEKAVIGEFLIESVGEATEFSQLGICVDTGVQTV